MCSRRAGSYNQHRGIRAALLGFRIYEDRAQDRIPLAVDQQAALEGLAHEVLTANARKLIYAEGKKTDRLDAHNTIWSVTSRLSERCSLTRRLL